MSAAATPTPQESLAMMLRALKMPTIGRHAEEVAQKAEREGWTFGQYLRHLVSLEVEERRRRRIERHQRESNLPGEKTLATLNRKRLPCKPSGKYVIAGPRRRPQGCVGGSRCPTPSLRRAPTSAAVATA